MSLGTTGVINAQSDMHVTAAASTVAGLRERADAVDLTLLDLNLGDGSTPARNIYALAGFTKHIIAYTAGDRPEFIRQAVRAGASAVIRKSGHPFELVDAIRQVMRGKHVVSAEWADALESDPEFTAAKLTRREAEVLALYASGESADSVAEALFISRETVYDHISRIRAKYVGLDRAAPTKVDLLRRAIEDGIVSVESAL